MRFLNKTQIDSLIRRLLYLCLLVAPFLMIYPEIELYYKQDIEQIKNTHKNIIQGDLLKYVDIADDHRFFHVYLKENFDKLKNKPFQSDKLASVINDVKKTFPNTFTFIFWDKKGNVMKSLSDDSQFIFLSKKMNALLKDVKAKTLQGLQNEPDFMTQCNADLRMLRQFLGPFVTPVGLTETFTNQSKAHCFRLHGRGERTMGWYEKYNEFSVIAFVAESGRNRFIGPKWHYKNQAIKRDFAQVYLLNETENKIFPAVSESIFNNIFINLGKYRRMVPDGYLETEHYIYCFQKINEDWWAIGQINKDFLFFNCPEPAKVLTQLVFAFSVFFFIFYCYTLVHNNPFNSVRMHLVFVFLYAIFIPVLMFSVLGSDYISQKEAQYAAQVSDLQYQTLLSVENQFDSYLSARSKEITDALNKSFSYEAMTAHRDKMPVEGEKIVDAFDAETMIVCDNSGFDMLGGKLSSALKTSYLLTSAAKEMLSYLNIKEDKFIRPTSGYQETLLSEYSRIENSMTQFIVNQEVFISYLHSVRNPETKEFKYLIQLIWKERDLHRSFLKTFVEDSNRGTEKKFIYAFPEISFYSHDLSGESKLAQFLDKVEKYDSHFEKVQMQDGKSFFAFGKVASRLNGAVVALLANVDGLESEIRELNTNIFWVIFWSIIITFSLFYILSHYLIKPIKELAVGVDMVKEKNYTHRIGLNLNNEFGKLGNSIDESLEALGELEIAKAVQESLLPVSHKETDLFCVYAKSLCMSNLGGDYYDIMFDQADNGIFLMADVAGHGVQAALLMAMAKTVLMLNSDNCRDAQKIMKELNSTFYTLRKSNISTMMTGQIVSTNALGEVKLLNAGHCPPFIVGCGGAEVKLIETASKPFGFGEKREFEEQIIKLNPGETLILYTDGILESTNKSGTMLGNNGLINLLKGVYDIDLMKYVDRLFEGYENWAPERSDDITFVLIRRKNNNEA